MKTATASIKLIQDVRRRKAGNTYPLRIRIIYKRVPWYYYLGYSLTLLEFVNMQEGRTRSPRLKRIKQESENLMNRAEKILQGTEPDSFRWEAFKEKFLSGISNGKIRVLKT